MSPSGAPVLLAVLLLGLTVLSGCGVSGSSGGGADTSAAGEPSASGRSIPGLVLDFDDVTAEFDSIVPRATNRGSFSTRSEVSTSNGGRLRLADSPRGAAVRFPTYAAGPEAPAAVLLVWDAVGDQLSPGDRDFAFGASFRLDKRSEGKGDNGDNLMQRGLFTDPVQFKVQLDHGVPSCRIAGEAGDVVAKLSTAVARERWYSLRCERRGEQVLLQLDDLEQDAQESVSEKGATGAVNFPLNVPVAVGAKVLPDGTVPTSATDQFNGVVDDIFFELDPGAAKGGD